MKRRILLLIFTIFLCKQGFMQTNAEPMRIYFRYGYREIDPSYRSNAATLQRMVRLINNAYRANEMDSVQVTSYASPDGSTLMNKRLAELRADSLASYLLQHTDVPVEMIKTQANGIGWHILREQVAASNMAFRREVLRIIDNTPEWIRDDRNVIVDGRKKQLMDLDGGNVYYYMKKHFFPDMRSCTAVSLFLKKDAKTLAEAKSAGMAVYENSAPAIPEEKSADEPTPQPEDTVGKAVETPAPAPAPQAVKSEEPEEEEGEALHRLAIKTNLLYDIALMPSLEIEYRINERWSVNLEGDIAWWKNNPKHKYYQLAIISPEGRYWFKTKKPWHGHYAGVFVGGGWFDLENGKRGYQGEGLMAGLSYGYMFPVTRCLSFEAGIGVGYMRAKYEEYLPEAGGHYLYQQTSRTNYVGPLKLKFALVWRLWDINKKKGGMQ